MIRFNRADVWHRRTLLHRHAKAGEHERCDSVRDDAAVFDKFLNVARISRDKIRRAVSDALLQYITDFSNDGHTVSGFSFERGGKRPYARNRTLVSKDDQLGRQLVKLRPETGEPPEDIQDEKPPLSQPISPSQPIRQPVNPYGRIALQPEKKIMMKARGRPEKEKFIMLDPQKEYPDD